MTVGHRLSERRHARSSVCDTSRMPKDTAYGFPRAAWEVAKAEAEDALVACARRRETTTYAGLCERVSAIRLRPYSFAMVAFLDEICSGPDAEKGIVLASLVTRKDTGIPGEGYFRCASLLGCDVGDRCQFWEQQVERVYAAFDDVTGS